jgi:Cd2+/Zn2+-exporting ATPase/Cu+-exporting ATPase
VTIRPVPNVSEEEVLGAAAIAELRSQHPLGKAIVRRAEERGLARIEPDAFSSTPGRGVAVQVNGEEIVVGNRLLLGQQGITDGLGGGNGTDAAARAASEVLVARGGRLLGVIHVADVVRPEAREAMRALGALGISTVLLTGDARGLAEMVAADVQVDEVAAELLPEDKVTAVTRLARGNHTVAMVGDGVNDAPALAQATVGVAMGSGTDVARESADVVLLGNNLMRFVETVRIARRAHGIIRFNFVGTLAVDAIGVGLAAFGLLSPLLAAFIHVTSELAFILNSARLLPAGARSRGQTG